MVMDEPALMAKVAFEGQLLSVKVDSLKAEVVWEMGRTISVSRKWRFEHFGVSFVIADVQILVMMYYHTTHLLKVKVLPSEVLFAMYTTEPALDASFHV